MGTRPLNPFVRPRLPTLTVEQGGFSPRAGCLTAIRPPAGESPAGHALTVGRRHTRGNGYGFTQKRPRALLAALNHALQPTGASG